MSYSRWSNSVWYTFWSSICSANMTYKLPTKSLKNKQCFEICDTPSYFISYGDIKHKGIDIIVSEVREFYSKDHFNITTTEEEKPLYKAKNPTDDQMNELSGYLKEFEKDIDDHFKLGKFFKYEWYYPIRNKLRFRFM